MAQMEFTYRKSMVNRKLMVSAFFVALSVLYWLFLHKSFSFWGDYAMVLTTGWFSYSCARAFAAWMRPLPIVTINETGIEDPYFGGVAAPWEAVTGIKAHALNDGYGGSFFVLVDISKLDNVRSLPVWSKSVKTISSSLSEQYKDTTVLTMTPIVALEATMDEVSIALKTFGQDIEIEYV